jgi:hypothetical protein
MRQRGREPSFVPGLGESWRPNPTIEPAAADLLYHATKNMRSTPGGVLSWILRAALNADGTPRPEFVPLMRLAAAPEQTALFEVDEPDDTACSDKAA